MKIQVEVPCTCDGEEHDHDVHKSEVMLRGVVLTEQGVTLQGASAFTEIAVPWREWAQIVKVTSAAAAGLS